MTDIKVLCLTVTLHLYSVTDFYYSFYTYWEYAVAHLVEALRYRSEGHGFGSRIPTASLRFFLLTKSFRPHFDSGIDSASNINEHHGFLLAIKAAGA